MPSANGPGATSRIFQPLCCARPCHFPSRMRLLLEGLRGVYSSVITTLRGERESHAQYTRKAIKSHSRRGGRSSLVGLASRTMPGPRDFGQFLMRGSPVREVIAWGLCRASSSSRRVQGSSGKSATLRIVKVSKIILTAVG